MNPGFIGSLRSLWKSLNFGEKKLQALESPWKQSRSLKVLEFECSIFWNFCILKFWRKHSCKIWHFTTTVIVHLPTLKNFQMCSSYNLFVYIFQNGFKCYVIVVTAWVWYVFLLILLVLQNCNFRSLRSHRKVLEFCPFRLLWTLLMCHEESLMLHEDGMRCSEMSLIAFSTEADYWCW